MASVDSLGGTTRTDAPAQRNAAPQRALLAVGRAVVVPVRALVGWWNRSIQARVVLGVLVLSTVLAFIAGWVLLHQVKDGLLASQRQAALPQAAAGFETARARLNSAEVSSVCPGAAVTGGCSDFVKFLNQLVDDLSPHEGSIGDYSVVVIGPLTSVRPAAARTWAPLSSGDIDVGGSVPARLVAQIRSSGGRYWAYTGLRRTAGGPTEPALVVGSQIRATSQGLSYGLLYVFPLVEQQDTLSFVERGLLGAGAVLIVLLGTIAWLVTRQVVTPVRLARRIAERLAAGRLEERMHVRGEDDLARLAQSFNQMAASLQRQIGQLEELSRVQRRFVADVSHELRTPLTTVRMASDLLYEARAGFDGPTARSVELLQNELDRFEGLLSDLLEISRFDAGAAVLEISDVDVGEVARQVVDAHATIAESSGSTIRLTVPDSPAVVQADVRRLHRIVRNLVSNALQYGEGSDVEIAVNATADAVTLLVRDSGLGLKPGEEHLVFNRFWRADPARARTRGGTGLGLSIAVEDTSLHGGVLDAYGRPGRGSVFRLTLPRRVGDLVTPLPLPLPEDRPADVPTARATSGGSLG